MQLRGLYQGQNRGESEMYDAKYSILDAECCSVGISFVTRLMQQRQPSKYTGLIIFLKHALQLNDFTGGQMPKCRKFCPYGDRFHWPLRRHAQKLCSRANAKYECSEQCAYFGIL